MLAFARNGADEGWWLRAERQSAGRGRQGREWLSPSGNFYGSTLVKLRASDPSAPTVAFVAAVALEEAACVFLAEEHRPRLAIKWPNDILLAEEKLAGILLERGDQAVVIGMGVNLAHHPNLADRRVTSLAAHGCRVAPDAFADVLVASFARWLSRWRGEGIEPVRRRWLERAHPVGTALTARLPDGASITGLFDGLDRDGALILRLADAERRVIHAGDIFQL